MSNTYNALIHAKQDGTGEEVANNLSGGSDLSDYAKQEELSNLVLTGTTNTSGATIAAGTCFVLNGDFVTAKVDIASGSTFTLNTNYEKKSVGSILTELNSNYENILYDEFSATSKRKAIDLSMYKYILLYVGYSASTITQMNCVDSAIFPTDVFMSLRELSLTYDSNVSMTITPKSGAFEYVASQTVGNRRLAVFVK